MKEVQSSPVLRGFNSQMISLGGGAWGSIFLKSDLVVACLACMNADSGGCEPELGQLGGWNVRWVGIEHGEAGQGLEWVKSTSGGDEKTRGRLQERGKKRETCNIRQFICRKGLGLPGMTW